LPVIDRPWTDFSQGELRSTSNPLDVALSGKGFFSINATGGPLYTRDGSFQLSPAGQLVTADGHAVRGADGAAIQLSSAHPVNISRDGAVLQDGQTVGQLEIVDFSNPAALTKQGHSYFRPGDGAIPRPAAAEVHQGALENSNTSGAEAAVRLVSVMRQFEMLQKAVAMSADMNRKAIEEVARV
jgi:flagellar basal body rod protein FlgG